MHTTIFNNKCISPKILPFQTYFVAIFLMGYPTMLDNLTKSIHMTFKILIIMLIRLCKGYGSFKFLTHILVITNF